MVLRHPRVQNTKSMSLPHELFCTGFGGRIFLQSNMNLPFPITHITPEVHPPVWFSEPEYAFYRGMTMREGKQRTIYNEFFLKKSGKKTFQPLLFIWFPIWYYDTKRRKQLDFLATPLLFAYVKQDPEWIRICGTHGSIEKQLRVVHPHNQQTSVSDLAFAYYTAQPKWMPIRPTI